jgi:hypothetical protein
MVIDTSADELWFLNSDTGSPVDSGGINATWATGATTNDPLDISSAVGATGMGGFTLYTDHGSSAVQLTATFASTASVTINGLGSGNSISYTSLSSSNQAFLEGLVSSAVPLFNGTDFTQIVVVDSSAVPEPSTYATLASLGILGFAVCRRRQQRVV